MNLILARLRREVLMEVVWTKHDPHLKTLSVHSLAILAESRLPDGRNTLVVHKRCWPEKIKFSRLTSRFQEFIKVRNRNIHIYANPVFGFKWLKDNRTTRDSQSEIRCLFTPSPLLFPPLELIAEFFPRLERSRVFILSSNWLIAHWLALCTHWFKLAFQFLRKSSRNFHI